MKRNTSWLAILAGGTMLALSLSLSGVASAAGTDSGTPTEQQITGAKTKADHEALAASYEQEAKGLEEKANDHKTMAKAYGKVGALEEKQRLVSHCNSLARKYGDAAKEASALAKLHRELAAKAKS